MEYSNKKKYLVIFGLMVSTLAFSQECLVPNGDFENYNACPHELTGDNSMGSYIPEIFPPIPWDYLADYGATPDYYNTCSTQDWTGDGIPGADVPVNFNGFQEARSGDGYAGLVLRVSTLATQAIPDYTEYITVPLSEPLQEGVLYEASMWISLAENRIYGARNVGMLFTNGKINVPSPQYSVLSQYSPQIVQEGILTDVENWQEVGGLIEGNGENYLTLGVFDFTNFPRTDEGSYIYIDDVCVRECENLPPEITGINGTNNYTYTASAEENFCFDFFVSDPEGWSVFISGMDLSDVPGATVTPISGEITTGTFCWTTPDVGSGTYSFTITVLEDQEHPNPCQNNTPVTATFYIDIPCRACIPKVYYENRNLLSGGPMNPLPIETISQSYIKAGFDVSPYLENGEVIVHGNQEVSFFGGTGIFLEAGFSVEAGAEFTAEIKNLCSPECLIEDLEVDIALARDCGEFKLTAITTGGFGNYNYTWSSNENGETIFVHHDVNTAYTVTVTDGIGNTAMAQTYLLPTPPDGMYQGDLVYAMPNGFTPNGDGVNDLFGPVTAPPFDENFAYNAFRYDFKIFNRLGQMVHHASRDIRNTLDYSFPGLSPDEMMWDGYLNGSLQAMDVLVYILELENCDHNISINGDVVLLRSKSKSFRINYDVDLSVELFPNPTSDKTIISFGLLEDDGVSLRVFNSTGKEIRTIFEKQDYPKGRHEVEIDLSFLPSGIYYFELMNKTGKEVKKLSIVR